jgi:hypothetical protein
MKAIVTLAAACALTLALVGEALALNPQPEPPNKPRISKPTTSLPPGPCIGKAICQ